MGAALLIHITKSDKLLPTEAVDVPLALAGEAYFGNGQTVISRGLSIESQDAARDEEAGASAC